MQPDHAVTSDDEDDQPLVRHSTRNKTSEERRDQTADDEDLPPLVPPRLSPVAPLRKRKGPSVWQDPTSTLEISRVK